MNAADALRVAQAAGIQVTIDGEDLLLSAPSQPPAEVLDLLAHLKGAIIILLRPGDDGLSSKDWQELFDERAGIAEFDGLLPHDQAEIQAFSCCVDEWLDRNPGRSTPGSCALCDQSKGVLLRYLSGNSVSHSNHTWLHHECSQAWYQERRAKAVAELALLLKSADNIFDKRDGYDRPSHTFQSCISVPGDPVPAICVQTTTKYFTRASGGLQTQ